jgi:zinc protease
LDRTFDFVAKREKRVADLTPGDIRSAFKKHIDPRKLVIIRAGDFKK